MFPPLRHIKRVLLLVMFGVFIALLSRNCNINCVLYNFVSIEDGLKNWQAYFWRVEGACNWKLLFVYRVDGPKTRGWRWGVYEHEGILVKCFMTLFFAFGSRVLKLKLSSRGGGDFVK